MEQQDQGNLTARADQASTVRDAKDAARYRWLREQYSAADFDWNDSGLSMLLFLLPRGVPVNANCDETIDAAIIACRSKEAA